MNAHDQTKEVIMNFSPMHDSSRRFPLASFMEDMFQFCPTPTSARWNPAVELREAPESYVLRVELPGVNLDDVDITVQNDVLTLEGKRESAERGENEKSHFAEFSYGQFRRSFTFPAPIPADGVTAESENGILTITLAKAKETLPTKVDIKTV